MFVALFALGSAGALAMAFTADTQRPVTTRAAPPVSLREFPAMPGLGAAPAKGPEPVAAKAPEPTPAEPEKTPEPEKAPEPAKTPEPVAAKPEPAKAPEPVAAKPAPAPAPVAAKPAPAPAAAPSPAPAPAPVAAKPAPAPVAEGLLNLRATDTADVFLDGKKLGGSPLLGVKAKAGPHKVRFDCYDAAGNTVAGTPQTVTVKADGEVDVEFPCPTE
jgi:outer membrane biosynthesis protein TonB